MRLTAARNLLWTGLLGLLAAAPQPAAEPGKLTIEQAVAEALANNPGLLAERVNIGIAEARVTTAGLRPKPSVSAGGDHLDMAGTRFNEFNAGGPAELNLRTDFVLERGGKRLWRVEAAQEARSIAELLFLHASRDLVLETQIAFLESLLSRDTLALARENPETLNRIVEINQARLRAGDLSKLELIRSQLAALQFRNSVRQGELRLRTALTRLATLLGREDPNSISGVEGELRRDFAIPSQTELQERARATRPDLLALRRDVARTGAEIRLQLQMAEAKFDYTLGAEFRRQQGINGRSNSVGFFIEAPLPLFNRNQGEIRRATQERRQAELRLRAQERALSAEIETAYQQYLAARDLLAEIEGAMIEQARDVFSGFP